MAPLTFTDILLRILSAFLAGLVIGWERETHGRAAGLRTTILTCLAAAMAMVLSEVLFVQSSGITGSSSWRTDPARLGAGILTGIGFLGGGAILRHGDLVRGVTTAACLWFVTVLGLALGSGEFLLGFLGLALAMITLHGLVPFERRIRNDAYATLDIVARAGTFTLVELKSQLEGLGLIVLTIKPGVDKEDGSATYSCELRLKKQDWFHKAQLVVTHVTNTPGVTKAKLG